MPKTSVFAPLLDEGLPSVNFFNGRLLSAEDLKTERQANREAHRRLAHGIGDGVVSGLKVRMDATSSADDPAVTVSAGLAVTRAGDPIRLPSDTRVSLLTAAAPPGGIELTPFRYCTPPRAGTYVAGAGVYLLAMTSTFAGKGRAPAAGLGNQITSCNTKYIIEGIEFVLMPIAADSLLSDPATLRNRLAYQCFGVEADASLAADLFGTPATGDPIAALRNAGTLTDCDVPLAVVYWTSDGIQFLDMWMVRRRPAPAVADALGHMVDPAQTARAEARLLQFQAHLAEILATSANPSTLEALTTFRFLPPAAFLPINGVRAEGTVLKQAVSTGGRVVDYDRFFGSHVHGAPRFIESARIGPLVRESFACPPIDLTSEQMFRLYVVRENVQAVESGVKTVPYMIVASPHVRFHADARFDVSRWDYSSFL
jgi:hypothetical protein